MAKDGFEVIGIDTNQYFIDIAIGIFKKKSLKGNFYCHNLEDKFTDEKFFQIIFLNVIEHISPYYRKEFIKTLHSYCYKGSTLIISIPNLKTSFKSLLFNFLKIFIYPLLTKYEHPYSIPSKKSMRKISETYLKFPFLKIMKRQFFLLSVKPNSSQAEESD